MLDYPHVPSRGAGVLEGPLQQVGEPAPPLQATANIGGDRKDTLFFSICWRWQNAQDQPSTGIPGRNSRLKRHLEKKGGMEILRLEGDWKQGRLARGLWWGAVQAKTKPSQKQRAGHSSQASPTRGRQLGAWAAFSPPRPSSFSVSGKGRPSQPAARGSSGLVSERQHGHTVGAPRAPACGKHELQLALLPASLPNALLGIRNPEAPLFCVLKAHSSGDANDHFPFSPSRPFGEDQGALRTGNPVS